MGEPTLSFLIDLGSLTREPVTLQGEQRPFNFHYHPTVWKTEDMGSFTLRPGDADPHGPRVKRRRMDGLDGSCATETHKFELKMKNPSAVRRSVDTLIDAMVVSTGMRPVGLIFVRMRIHEGKEEDTGKPIRLLSMLIQLFHRLHESFKLAKILLDADLPHPDLITINMLQMPVLFVENILYPVPTSLKYDRSCMDDERLPIDAGLSAENDIDKVVQQKKEARINRWWKDVLTSHFPDATTRLAYSRDGDHKVHYFIHLAWASDMAMLHLINGGPVPPRGSPGSLSSPTSFGRSQHMRGVIHWMNPKDTKDHLMSHIEETVRDLKKSEHFIHMSAALQDAIAKARINDPHAHGIDGDGEKKTEYSPEIDINVVSQVVFQTEGYDHFHYVKSVPSSMSIALELRDIANNRPILFWAVEPTAHWRSYTEALFPNYCNKFPFHMVDVSAGEAGGWKSRGRYDPAILATSSSYGPDDAVRCLPPVTDYLETTRLVVMPEYSGLEVIPWFIDIWKLILSYESTDDPDRVQQQQHLRASADIPIRIRSKSETISETMRKYELPEEISGKRGAYRIFWMPHTVVDADGETLWTFQGDRFEQFKPAPVAQSLLNHMIHPPSAMEAVVHAALSKNAIKPHPIESLMKDAHLRAAMHHHVGPSLRDGMQILPNAALDDLVRNNTATMMAAAGGLNRQGSEHLAAELASAAHGDHSNEGRGLCMSNRLVTQTLQHRHHPGHHGQPNGEVSGMDHGGMGHEHDHNGMRTSDNGRMGTPTHHDHPHLRSEHGHSRQSEGHHGHLGHHGALGIHESHHDQGHHDQGHHDQGHHDNHHDQGHHDQRHHESHHDHHEAHRDHNLPNQDVNRDQTSLEAQQGMTRSGNLLIHPSDDHLNELSRLGLSRGPTLNPTVSASTGYVDAKVEPTSHIQIDGLQGVPDHVDSSLVPGQVGMQQVDGSDLSGRGYVAYGRDSVNGMDHGVNMVQRGGGLVGGPMRMGSGELRHQERGGT